MDKGKASQSGEAERPHQRCEGERLLLRWKRISLGGVTNLPHFSFPPVAGTGYFHLPVSTADAAVHDVSSVEQETV